MPYRIDTTSSSLWAVSLALLNSIQQRLTAHFFIELPSNLRSASQKGNTPGLSGVMSDPGHLARMNAVWLRLTMALLFGLSIIWAAPGHAGSATPIFVLHSYSQEYPWTRRQHEAYMSTLGASVPDSIDA